MARTTAATMVTPEASRKNSESTSDDRCSAPPRAKALNNSASTNSARAMITYPLMVRRYEANSRRVISMIARTSGRLLLGRGRRRARGELEEDRLQPVADPVQAIEVHAGRHQGPGDLWPHVGGAVDPEHGQLPALRHHDDPGDAGHAAHHLRRPRRRAAHLQL